MAFNEVAEVRVASGLVGNTDITDEVIGGHIEDANNVMLGYIGSVYNVINFAGANFTGSHAEGMLKKIELFLSAGYLLTDEYGPQQLGGTTDGEQKIEKAMEMISKIIGEGTKVRIKLLGNDGVELPKIGVTSTMGRMRSAGLVGNKSKFSVDDTF